ncbi:DUF2857 domain-containing protein [Citrobacter koseri]|uniref:DUF2857 domain-containing protein n=1 Tax=Citrobacter koseri TaxID=545 RepID=UPI0028BE51B3|nr:DUF2857 domain-containing protein [Citrobacter koseri]MDT7487262.1 DUF2857 domain-containing protein [Citrobacter koseri]
MLFPSLNYLVLIHTLHALNEGDIHHCESLGFTCNEMKSLGTLTVNELLFLSRSTIPLVTLSLHHENLHQCLLRTTQETQRQQMINRAIRLGGSIELLSDYFGLTSGEVCFLRRMADVHVPNGRPPLPDEVTDAQLWHLWQQYPPGNLDSLEALDVMMHITEVLSSGTGTPPSLTMVRNRIFLWEQEKQGEGAGYAR